MNKPGMNTAIRCHLSARPGLCTGFVEGLFVRFYQQSLFAWNSHASAPLTVTGHQVKKMSNSWVLSGGLPLEAFRHYHPDLEIIDARVTLSIPRDEAAYTRWYREQVAAVIATRLARQEVCRGNAPLAVLLPAPVVSQIEAWDLLTATGSDTQQLMAHLRHAVKAAQGA